METAPLDRIDTLDRRFCISYPLDDDVLFSSIQKVGLIQPILLLETVPLLVITGFKRLHSAMRLGLREIPCVTIRTTERQALLYAIHDNLGRGLNTVEKAYALEKMLHLGFPKDDIYEVMGMLLLSPHEKVLSLLVATARAEEAFKAFIVSRSVSMKNLEQMLRFDERERALLIPLFSTLHMTESHLREVLQMMSIAKIKEGKIDLEDLCGATHTEELRKRLKRKVRPLISAREERLREIRHACGLPPNIDIEVDPFFEKEYIDISIRAKEADEIQGAVFKLNRLLEAGYMGSILELTKG
jgi:hypothetical protein